MAGSRLLKFQDQHVTSHSKSPWAASNQTTTGGSSSAHLIFKKANRKKANGKTLKPGGGGGGDSLLKFRVFLYPVNRWFSRYVIDAMLVDENKRLLIISFCSSTSNLTYLTCTFCFPISDHVMFSREFAFCFFVSYSYISTCVRRHLKKTVLYSKITWSERGKQNLQAETH